MQPAGEVYFEQPKPQSNAVKVTAIIVVGIILLCGLCGLITLVASAVQPDKSPYTPYSPAPTPSISVSVSR